MIKDKILIAQRGWSTSLLKL